MKSLVIAEKPSVGRDIARVLKCSNKKNGSITGGRYIVTWGLGHLVTLADPESYDKKYKEWRIEDLPMLPKKTELEVIRQTAKQYQVVKNYIHDKEVGEIIIATDAGREGELVARLILEKAGNKKPVKRLWISSVTDKAIREGFAALKPGREYENLYRAAMARAQADWFVGMNATRALTCKHNASLSCGRVQTPTLAMIAKREEEIKKFVPKEYYGIQLNAAGIRFTWQDGKTGSHSTFLRERVEQILDQKGEKQLVIDSVSKTKKKTYAPGLYDLTQLQSEANRRFHFSAKETLNIAQRLYENHKVLTYPRTDSRYLSADIVPTLKERLKACSTGPYKKPAARVLQGKITAGSSFVNDKKVTDHHAIIPTEQYADLSIMTVEERKIYDLVVRRFISVLYPPFQYEQTTVLADVNGERFTARGKIILDQGFKEVYQDEDETDSEDGLKDQTMPELKKGEKYPVSGMKMTTGKTKPPAPFNESTLILAMENPKAYLESKDKDMMKTLDETGGLGTVATRADIIEKLFHSFLIEKRGNDIFVTAKARQLLQLVPEDLRKPELTADWEMKLSKIAKGNLNDRAFLEEIRKYTVQIVDEIKGSSASFTHDNMTNKKCPECGKRLLAVNGKNARMLVCQDRECGYRETVARTSNARCPVCHKKMEMIGNGDKALFVCKCGHKERLDKFKERRNKEGAGVNKKDVQRYLKKQEQEAKQPVNNDMAALLGKIKLD